MDESYEWYEWIEERSMLLLEEVEKKYGDGFFVDAVQSAFDSNPEPHTVVQFLKANAAALRDIAQMADRILMPRMGYGE